MSRVYLSLREILEKDIPHGGKLVGIFGKPGSGKTGLLHGIESKICEHEICIFRGQKTGQEFRFPGQVKTFAYQCKPKFYDALGNQMNVKVKIVPDFDDALENMELGKLNVLYMPFADERRYWVDFARFLVQRFPSKYASNFVSLFMDEFEDISPAPEEGTTKQVREWLNEMKEFRVSLISLYFATQQFFDIHWRALGKTQYRIYLPGALVPRREARVAQMGVDSLKLGEGIIAGSFFSYFTFGNYPTREIVVVR